jgi:hypothetical protein
MSEVIQLREDDYNGLCPKCHSQGINYHEERDRHWSVCKKHKLKWWTGSVFSFPFTDDDGEWSWDRGEELLKRNRFILASCRTVEPFFWPQRKQPMVSVISSGQEVTPGGDLVQAWGYVKGDDEDMPF